jgi:hypothetical protein
VFTNNHALFLPHEIVVYILSVSYKRISLHVVLYRCETWSLTLRGKHRLRVLENRVLRRIFGPKREKVAGGWRRLHNEKLHSFYSLSNIIRLIKSRRMRWTGNETGMEETRNAHNILVRKRDGKRPLGRPRRRWEDNIRMAVREI